MNRKAEPLTIAQILVWADDHKGRTGRWPRIKSGVVLAKVKECWIRIDSALRLGLRGLPGGDSLPQLLARERGGRDRRGRPGLPPLTEAEILVWADDHKAHTGEFPIILSGPVLAQPGVNWKAIDMALRAGSRGLPGGSSLARLLARERARPDMRGLNRLNAARRQQAQDLRTQGLTLAQIGERMGCSRQNVFTLLRPHGRETPTKT
jgi:hypothetical protein